MSIERSTIGLFCADINRVNTLYDELEIEEKSYSAYDGGQQPFTETEFYTERMDEIHKIERRIGTFIRNKSKPSFVKWNIRMK